MATAIAVVALVVSCVALYIACRNKTGQILDNKIKNSKGETIYEI